MKPAIIFSMSLLVAAGEVSAQQVGPPPTYQMNEVYKHCRAQAPFIQVGVTVTPANGGNKIQTDVISCLSNKDGLLVTIVCNKASQKCEMDRKRDDDTPGMEETLRQLERDQRERIQGSKV